MSTCRYVVFDKGLLEADRRYFVCFAGERADAAQSYRTLYGDPCGPLLVLECEPEAGGAEFIWDTSPRWIRKGFE